MFRAALAFHFHRISVCRCNQGLFTHFYGLWNSFQVIIGLLWDYSRATVALMKMLKCAMLRFAVVNKFVLFLLFTMCKIQPALLPSHPLVSFLFQVIGLLVDIDIGKDRLVRISSIQFFVVFTLDE